MDFQNMNSFNARLNLLSGNLLPMTADNASFSIFWRVYSTFVWLLQLVHTVSLISGCFFVPMEKVLNDGVISLVVIAEEIIMITRIHAQKTLVRQLIQKLNDGLRVEDEIMRRIVMTNLKPMYIPLRFYMVVGALSASTWCCISLPLIFEKNTFLYADYKMPATYSKEPFSISIFLLGSIMILISNTYVFTKKVSVDVYTTYLVSLITSQYQYIALRLASIFRDPGNIQDNNDSSRHDHFSRIDFSAEKGIRNLCRHHNSVIRITLMLKKLLSLNFSLIYVNSVFRFCFIGVMMTKISASLLEGSMVFMYGSSAIVQFYILCSCVQKLLEASTEITDKAFHEEWYRFSLSVKRTFMLVIMASNNLEIKLSTFERFNLSLPSFMAVLNQSYSFALLILRIN